jgi:hypothetical protein
VVISEFMASNNNGLTDSFGEHSDWIELHNRGDAAQDLNGYFLTDSGTALTMWRFPAVTLNAGGYLVVFASQRDLATAGSELHTNFKLDAAGEYLALVKPDGVTIQHAFSPAFPAQSTDVSYGLSFDNTVGNFEEQPFTTPTPGAANIANAPVPSFSVTGRAFSTAFSLTLTAPLAGAQIRYTVNGSAPTATSPLYSVPLTISNSTIVRARTFATGRTASPIVSQTYLALDASVANFNSNLPVVVIDTFGSGVSDTSQTTVGTVILDTGADGRTTMLSDPNFSGRAGINTRGQSSLGFPKKQYHFELWDESNQDTDAPLLGMPADSDWVLYAPYSEKAVIQNYLAYKWSNELGDYAVRTRWVEVFMNGTAGNKVDYAGDYQGVYLLMEKIKVGDDRVDIKKMTPADNAGDAVTGGYVFAKDKPDPGEAGFTAAGLSDWRFVEPGTAEITQAQKDYLANYINEFNSVLNGPNFADPVNGYAKYIDVDSFIDQHILTELTKNIDGYRISTYYSKDRNGKIKMGPAWDFNLSLGNGNYNDGQNPTGWYWQNAGLGASEYPFFPRLFQDPAFKQRYIDRWEELRKTTFATDKLMADIDAAVNVLTDGNGNYPVGTSPVQTPTNPIVRNFTKWQILGQATWPNYYTDPSWLNQINWTKDWLRQRVTWWDGQYLAAPAITPAGGPVTGPTQVTITSTGATGTVDTPLLSSGAPAKALVPTQDIGTSWRNRTGFDDSAWISGTTGVGYDQGAGGVDYLPLIGLPVDMRNINQTVYIRVPFNLSNPASVQTLILRMKYDDGFVAYLNGTEVARTPNAPATPVWNAGASGTHDDNQSIVFQDFDISTFKNLLVSGTNVLAIQGLNSGAGSSDLLMLPELVSRSTTAQQAPVYYTTDGTDPRLPNGNISPAATLYAGPFTVSSTARVMARVKVNATWSGLDSELYDFGDNRLRIAEIMYNPAPPPNGSAYLPGDFEYVELVNTGTQAMNLNRARFDKGIDFTFGDYTLQPGARVLVVRNQAAFESRYGTGKPIAGTFTGQLSDGGERVRLLGRFGEVVHDFSYADNWYPQTDGFGWSLTAVDPSQPLAAYGTKAGWRASEPFGGTPGTTDNGLKPNSVVINELMANPATGPDWVELRNTTASDIPIGNFYLSDTATNLKKYRIPAGTTVPANGYLVLSESQFGFDFSDIGEGVYLSSGDAAGDLGGYRVDETFDASEQNATFGRIPLSTGGADFGPLVSATQGTANTGPVIGPVVINEIMYQPLGAKSEYIELRNITGSAVTLGSGWKFAGGIDYAFPAGTSIPANGYLILSAIDPATFRTQYSVPAGVTVVGPYTLANGTNVLSNAGESVKLMRPNSLGTGFVLVDRVAYDDEAPWPAETNGTGQSLGRIDSAAYGNDPANWAAELLGGSPGRPNLDDAPPTADVIDVTPDPRTTAINTITILFSEPVTGLDLADLRLTRNGSTVPLTASQTLTTGDNVSWVLNGLAGLTGASGTYALTLTAAGSGITDTGGRALAADASDTWVTNADTSPPSATITAVAPDPRNTAVGTIAVVFSEPVTGVDRSDFTLTRNGGANLLTASQTVTTTDNVTWTISNLSSLTGGDGTYVLTLKSSGTGITDSAANPLAGGAVEQWVMDATRPLADVVDVTPDPRGTPVGSITISFSEPVVGFDRSDLVLTRNGGANLLTAAQTLTTADNKTWTLGNLLGLTAAGGVYTLAAVANPGITDAAGNTLSTTDLSDSWTVDATPPTADIVDVSPDPRNTAVDTVAITFSEPVSGFDVTDLVLQAGAGGNLLTAAQTLTTSDNVTYTLGNLAAVTGNSGTYTLRLVSGVSAITDAAGNSLAADATETWTVDSSAPTADVVDVTPDPRNTAVDSVTIVFNKPVTGFGLSDLQLVRQGTAGNLLTAAQTLTSADGMTWTLANLAGLTTPGFYTLTLTAAGSGIADAAGNTLAADASDSFLIDLTGPTADVEDVGPDPRNTGVPEVIIRFNEPILGIDLADLRLTRDGNPQNLLAGSGATLDLAPTAFPNPGTHWRLGGISNLTAPAGNYVLTVVAAGSGITDRAGNALAADASDAWAVDSVAPTADVVDVSPDPNPGTLDQVTITFSEPVTGLNLADLSLTRDGGANLLTGSQTLTTTDNVTWTLGGLFGLASADGAYTLRLASAGSGITDAAGNPLAADATDSWTVAAPTVSVSQVFVRGDNWTASFKGYLEGKGLGDDVAGFRLFGPGRAAPAGNEDDVLPWINLDQVVVSFAADPGLVEMPHLPEDFLVTGRNGGAYAVTRVDPVPGLANTFALTLARPLGGGNLAAGAAPTAAENGDVITLQIPGVRVNGAPYALAMNVLQGDVDHTGENGEHTVLAGDYSLVKKKFFRDTGSPVTGAESDYSPFADVDGSGGILANDFSEVKKRFFQGLSQPAAVAPASVASATPLTGSSVTKDVFATSAILA